MVMTNALAIELVTASAEQTPKTCKAIGLLSTTGPKRTFLVSEAIIVILRYDISQ